MSEWQARHLRITLEVAAHIDREDKVDMAGSLVGINKFVLVMFLQVNGRKTTGLRQPSGVTTVGIIAMTEALQSI